MSGYDVCTITTCITAGDSVQKIFGLLMAAFSIEDVIGLTDI
jgi:hypothetical protein